MTNNRIGTGYIHKPEDVAKIGKSLAERDHPLRIRWRNEECRAQFLDWEREQMRRSFGAGRS